MSMNKVVSQGHLVLTAGADGFAKIWVSEDWFGITITSLYARRLSCLMIAAEISGLTAIFQQDRRRTRSTSSSHRLTHFRPSRRGRYSLLPVLPTRARERFDLPV